MSHPYIRCRTVIIIVTAILLGFTDLTAWGRTRIREAFLWAL
jgi:hypothetical protein